MPDPKFPSEDDERELTPPALTARTRALNPSSHDAVLQARIWEQLRATRELDAAEISIVVRNRSATLFGTIADEGQRKEVERIASGVSGVLEVTNRVKLAAPTH